MSVLAAVAFANRFSTDVNYTPGSTLATPTYDGSGETTEPTWIRKPSWVTVDCTDILAHNPLPGGNSDFENPSLLISNDDGATWTTPPGLTNPITPKPTADGTPGANADCHLFADPNAHRLVMTWGVQAHPTGNQNGIWYSVCTDPALVTWGAKTGLLRLNIDNFDQEDEPKIVWDAVRGKYLLFTEYYGSPNAIKIRIGGSSTPLSGYGAPTTCSLSIPGGDTPWHMDIRQEANGRFVMVFCDTHFDDEPVLKRQGWIASSWDGIHWKCAPRPFMEATDDWAVQGVYRPTLIPNSSGGYDMIVARHQNPTAQLGLVRGIPATEVP